MNADIEQLSFEAGEGERIHGIWYYIPDDTELQQIQLALKNHLNK